MPLPAHLPDAVSRHNAITALLEAIAKQEASISNILNAQGQTLQEALQAEGITPAQVIELSQALNNTMRLSTLLEKILQGKLQSLYHILSTM